MQALTHVCLKKNLSILHQSSDFSLRFVYLYINLFIAHSKAEKTLIRSRLLCRYSSVYMLFLFCMHLDVFVFMPCCA